LRSAFAFLPDASAKTENVARRRDVPGRGHRDPFVAPESDVNGSAATLAFASIVSTIS